MITFNKTFSTKNEQFNLIFRYNGIEVTKMDKKCRQYEGLFIFQDEENLLEHIKTCEDCRAEYEKMEKVSSLIQEAAPMIKQKHKNKSRLKLACASFALIFLVSTLSVINLNTDIRDKIMYGHTLTVEDYGLPVDSYGLIMVGE